MDDEASAYGRGRAFLRGCGVPYGGPVPAPGDDLAGWVRGYAAALADDDPEGECPSLEFSLRADGVEGSILEALLRVAEAIERGEGGNLGFACWPGCPVRHSAEALKARDERLALNVERLFDEDWPRD